MPGDAIDDFLIHEGNEETGMTEHTCHEGQWATPAQNQDHCPRCQELLGLLKDA